ncbi:fatty acid amide hydrolase [Aneurinibacillus soli]|uniref:Glutamyl-tRNA(Gln) amidotransferase subunit A n=1 Tax=Aneurinibacillus soli TaxID=1500254 RepID=A0A0U5B9N4_9BACL|nr:amidase family protein [Aneurinibacillus soli]PYE64361.1 fatty acid amide hydrolase [Aneurinibacillus soli]BAU28310.1 Glutamyl-tRNA(Gln) amidotransferase subunit A [Aneurinibacillus soli]
MKLYTLSAIELAKGIRNGEFTSLEVVHSFIERIKSKNQDINAIAIPLFDKACAEAKRCDEMVARGEFLGPLHGVPVTVKESIHVAGTPSTWGIEGKDDLLKEDDPSVERLQNAGAIILAKTNPMQLLMGCETFNPVYGRTNNPWNLQRTSGGSSGGEGAAVASMFSALGIGTDIGGSIRTPAHFCGVHGLKPTPGIVPQHPPKRITHIRREAGAMSSVGPIARTVADLKLAFEVLVGKEINLQTIDGLKIGVWTTDHILPPSRSIIRAIEEAAGVLAERGANVVAYEFPLMKESMQNFYGIMCADGGKGVEETLGASKWEYPVQKLHSAQRLGRGKRKLAVSVLKLLGQQTIGSVILPFTGAKTEEEYQQLLLHREQYRDQVIHDMQAKGVDAVICPVFPTPALFHNGSRNLSYEGAYNSLINYLGFPSGAFSYSFVKSGEEVLERNKRDIVQKAAMDAETGSRGLPVAVQIISRPHKENIVLSIMAQLEESSRERSDYPPTRCALLFE